MWKQGGNKRRQTNATMFFSVYSGHLWFLLTWFTGAWGCALLCKHPRLIWTPVFGLSLSVAQQNDLLLRLATLPQSLRRSQVLVFMSVGENPLSWAIWCVSLALLFLWAVPLRDQQHCASYRIDSHRLLCWMSFQTQHSALFLAWGLQFWWNLAEGVWNPGPPSLREVALPL